MCFRSTIPIRVKRNERKPVIHTVAHLMNVINFSNNFDPLLSNLNMAEYKGQNPLQLLVSGK
jgi:hypothetical protein